MLSRYLTWRMRLTLGVHDVQRGQVGPTLVDVFTPTEN